MARIYERSNSPYWWTEYKGPRGEQLRQSTKVPAEKALKDKAQLKANQMELAEWKDWAPGREKVAPRSYDATMKAYIEGEEPGKGHLYCIKELTPYFRGRIMQDLTKVDIYGYLEWRRPRNKRYKDRPVANATMRRELSVLSVAINYVNEHLGWELPNPVLGRRPKPAKHRIRWAPPEEASRLIRRARERKRAPWLQDFIELGFNTGMRKMEMLSCELERVDLRQDVIHLRPEDQKNGQYGTVPLNRNAKKVILRRLSWIAEHCPTTPWLFPSRIGGGKDHMSDVRKPFLAACDEAGIRDFRPHDLRHTFASWLVQAGVPLAEVKEAMRHCNIKETEKYAHLAKGTAARVVSVLDGVQRTHTITHTDKIDTSRDVLLVEKLLMESRC